MRKAVSVTSKKLISRVLINTDQHNVVYGVLFHSSLIPIVKIMNIIASIQQEFFNLMIKYTALEQKAILHPHRSTKMFFPVPRLYRQVRIR